MLAMLVLVLARIVLRQRPIGSLGAQKIRMRRGRRRRHGRLRFGLHAAARAQMTSLVSVTYVRGRECSPVTRRRCWGCCCCPSQGVVDGSACGDSQAGTGRVRSGTRGHPVVLRRIRSGRACGPVGRRRPRGVWASWSPAVGNKSAAVGADGELRMGTFGTHIQASAWRAGKGEAHLQMNGGDSAAGSQYRNPRAIVQRCFLLLSCWNGDCDARFEMYSPWRAGSHFSLSRRKSRCVTNFQVVCLPDHIARYGWKYETRSRERVQAE